MVFKTVINKLLHQSCYAGLFFYEIETFKQFATTHLSGPCHTYQLEPHEPQGIDEDYGGGVNLKPRPSDPVQRVPPHIVDLALGHQ